MRATSSLTLVAAALALSPLCLAKTSTTAPASLDLTRLMLEGTRLSADAAAAMEAHLKDHPDDAASHAKLIGYYFIRQRENPQIGAARLSHILWMIEHYPTDRLSACPFCQIDPSGAGYDDARKQWMNQVETHPDSAPILAAAANFIAGKSPLDAETFLHRAATAEPDNPRWHEQLAALIARGIKDKDQTADQRTAMAREALVEYERALTLTTDKTEKSYLYPDLAAAALAAGDEPKAKRFANAMLSAAAETHDWNTGNAIYQGNTLLGQIALAHGDIEAAKQYLLASAKTPGSPQLDSFGPNTTLARDLLLKGQRDAVLQYFILCGNFWKMGADRLKKWTATVNAGGMPDWGATLNY